MIISPERVAELEAQYQREAYANLSYAEALAIFTALWVHARVLRPDLGHDWEEDLEADLAVARAVNGLPPRPSRASQDGMPTQVARLRDGAD